MSTTMRLKRFGTKKRPYYRVVIQDNRSAACSKTIEEIGTYSPIDEENQVKLDIEKCKAWISKGVTVSPTVKEILNKQGISLDRSQN